MILGKEPMGGEPKPYPPQNVQSHSTCPTPYYLTFSVSSIIHRLFVNNRKYYFSWFQTLEKQTGVPGHRHTLLPLLLLWVFLISPSTTSVLRSAQPPALSRTSVRGRGSLSLLGGPSFGREGGGEGCGCNEGSG